MKKQPIPLNHVYVPTECGDAKLVHWTKAFPRDYAEQFKGIPPATVPEYRPDE